ncbi:hypothetical protein M404DRAFT_316727 [Pisolithus tinctorius Marx 270]|uniref:Uncharacterized protein n=1 Tax=Pisolithus tinctorius Marx 270 TaxID=870435 RepID=A0A0C3NI75_PISTI|nr:hypothetical protein M404DRAFT_316727 [Pisolithus tinctorius Marx 270]
MVSYQLSDGSLSFFHFSISRSVTVIATTILNLTHKVKLKPGQLRTGTGSVTLYNVQPQHRGNTNYGLSDPRAAGHRLQ